MSATVDYAPYAWCHDCAEGSEVGITRDEAEEWAATHDAENHETDNSSDEAYERFKEARDG